MKAIQTLSQYVKENGKKGIKVTEISLNNPLKKVTVRGFKHLNGHYEVSLLNKLGL